MAATFAARFILLVLLCINLPRTAEGGKVKAALFNMFGSGSSDKKPSHNSDKFDEDQAKLMEFLTEIGFAKYATEEWLERFDEDLAYDSIEDMAHLVADEDFAELKIDKEDAIKIQYEARKHIVAHFLSSVPVPAGAAPDTFTKLLEPLIAAGYDEPDDIADIELDEIEGLGIEKAHHQTIVTFAEEFETRELLELILVTYEPKEGTVNPFASSEVWKPLVEVMVKFGVRNLSDVSNLSPMEGLTREHLELLKNDPRVTVHATKQEL
uniref:SAM domain-containing protein n=1 Tax=Haptolina brevifila TaxID=156173 RepID=A0A7S2CZE0_9EUKA